MIIDEAFFDIMNQNLDGLIDTRNELIRIVNSSKSVNKTSLKSLKKNLIKNAEDIILLANQLAVREAR